MRDDLPANPRWLKENAEVTSMTRYRPVTGRRDLRVAICILQSPARRRGITLLEVLVSIFIITFGLLGVLAVIPIGRFDLAEMHKADRAAACGRAGLREAQLRGFLNPRLWLYRNRIQAVVLGNPAGDAAALEFGEGYALDPLFIANNQGPNDGPTASFPYGVSPPFVAMKRVTLDPDFDMNRLTPIDAVASAAANQVNAALHRAVFDRIFTWPDILNVPVPEVADERPRQFITALDTSSTPSGLLPCAWPPSPVDGVPPRNVLAPLMRQSLADFTWMITVAPRVERSDFFYDADGDGQPDDYDGDGIVPDFFGFLRKKGLYDVSVVVFHKRDVSDGAFPPAPGEPAAERVAMIEQDAFLGAGLSGGDVALSTVAPSGSPRDLELRKGQWLLLCGVQRVVDPSNGNLVPTMIRKVFKWYRVVAVGDFDPSANRPTRYVTLAGPDWDPNWSFLDTDGDGVRETQAALFSDTAGVYTVTTELHWNSIWEY
ncbi:MAG TPA: hypothetical protein EYH34_07570 [Planctomycetes bacterium]|nr:hypothetical protein [Planctomycetota bacterium]